MTTQAGITLHTDISVRAHVNYVLARTFAKQLYRIWPLTELGFRLLAMLDTAIGKMPRLRGIDHALTELGPVPVEQYLPTTVADDGLAGATVLYLHGGGFTFCGVGTHQRVASRLALTLGVPVYSILYRQLPHGGVGSAVHDALAAYRSLLETCEDPSKIVVAGDSSGGFLAAKLCELAAADGLTPPVAYIGYSAHVNLDADDRDHSVIGRDALMPVSAYKRVKQRWLGGPIELRGERSVLAIDPQVFPPTFLTAAAKEMFEADIRDLSAMLVAGGRTVETHVWRRQVHAFPVLDGLLPESTEALRMTGAFLREQVFRRGTAAA